jgi:alkaline phosphatase
LLVVGGMIVTASQVNAVDNVILFIGDGMGPAHVKAGRAFVNGDTSIPLTFENLGFNAESVTTLPDGAVTDSATAATAMATGYQHPLNGIISMGADNSIKTTLIELAKARGMRTAIITTDDIGGATPGAFGAHEPDCTLMGAIRADYLRADAAQGHAASLPYLLMGGGYDDPAVLPGTTYKYVDLAQSLGYQFVSTDAGLGGAGVGRVLGLFGTSWAPMTSMAYRSSNSAQPTLSRMLAKALWSLENPNGFFVVVESANIDTLSHSKDANFVAEVAELNAAVEVATAWRDSHNLYDNTLIFVTADHETGGLAVPDQIVPPSTVPKMTFSSTGHTAANVPLFANWPPAIAGLMLDNTDTFFLVQDALNYTRGGQPPAIAGLTVSAVTESSAAVQWTTTEPSGSIVVLTLGGSAWTFASIDWGNAHSVTCTGLSPGTAYSVSARSTDLAGFTGMATSSFVTAGGDPNAHVMTEPVVSLGTVSGTYQGVSAAADGLKQNIMEATEGAGAGLTVDYTLHTPVSADDIDSVTLQASFSWTASDGTADAVLSYVRVLAPEGGYLWEPISFPFVATPASSFVDSSGNIVVRFEDGATIKRERKDTLTVDYLAGAVVKNPLPPVLPTAPMNLIGAVNGSQVSLSWSDSSSETGYQVWRYTSAAGWKILAQIAQNATAYNDATVSSSTTYHYVVRACNADAYADSQPASVTVPVILSTPSNVKASAVKGAISVTWTDTNTAETSYEVLRGTTPGGNFTVAATLAANAASYSDKNIVRGTTYYYRVRAVKSGQTGPESATVSATAR